MRGRRPHLGASSGGAPPVARRRGVTALAVGGALAVVVLAVGGGTALYASTQLGAPSAAAEAHRVTVTVHPQESVGQLADDLAAHGLVRSAFWFGWYARLRGLGGHLRAGDFTLDTGMGASAVVARLEASPDTPPDRVVLPEGMTAAQMAARIEAAHLGITAASYLQEVRHGSFRAPFLEGRPAAATLEGFLFPDTYAVPAGTGAHAMVQMQLDDFGRRAAPHLHPVAGLTVYQTVVLASIVEREARFPGDRPLVASVYYNRLAAGMNLQADATVLYGLGVSGQSPTLDQLKQDTPYNTYLHAGLPPTPIANPGLASLLAAASPAHSDYLFYVSDKCGYNHYSVTQAEHDQQVSRYLDAPCP